MHLLKNHRLWLCVLSSCMAAAVHAAWEADVAPRPNGDDDLLVNDWVQVGRYVAGLDAIEAAPEFQRADCAPIAFLGDGELLVNDWVQAGRYVAGLDAALAQGGPTGGFGDEGETETIFLPGGVPLVLVKIPAGTFQMGSPDAERGRFNEEGPVHTVTISSAFYLGKYEVTQQQWLAVMGSWPGPAPSSSNGLGNTYPAYFISWDAAQSFITALNAHIAATEQGPAAVRLPTEAEWEYACRAGTTTRYYYGDSLDVDDDCEDDGVRSQYMWYCGNNNLSGSKPVGGKLPNAFGLYDMSGNVWEWCEDDWHGSYTDAPADGSAWVESPRGSDRVFRGGRWDLSSGFSRSAFRSYYLPSLTGYSVGFRLAM